MKRSITMLLAVLFCLNSFTQTIKPSKGDGSANDPYQIGDAQELLWFANLVNGKLEDETKDSLACAELTTDIDLSEVCGEDISSWCPIGFSDNQYSGTFDGKGYGIKNLYINGTSAGLGFFGRTNSASISNLSILTGSINSKGNTIGGIAGNAYKSTITNCHNYIPVTGGKSTGGIVGYTNGSTISKCHNEGSIKLISDFGCGGICGATYGAKISYCCNIGKITASNRAGALIGNHENGASLKNSFAYNSNVSLIGYNSNSSYSNCYFNDINDSSTSSLFKSKEQFANGEVCYLLNDGLEEPVFFQSIGSDEYPVFNGSDVVLKDELGYYNESQLTCEHKEKKTVAPTCMACGYNYCTKCHVKSDTVPAIPHDTVVTVTNAPTCTKIGYSTAQCGMCDLKYYNCDTVPALGHDNTLKHFEKTCHTEARTDTTCGRCSGIYKRGVTEEAPTMQHNYEDDICIVCGLPRSEKPESKDGYLLIKNARELLWFSEYVYAGNTKVNAKLTADIDLSEVCGDKIKKNWLPIGDIDKKEWAFAGEFDGQGHTISNLFFNNKYITKDSLCYRHPEFDGDDIGLFGGNSGLIKNVKLKGLSITSVRYVGGISANNYGTITDCSIESSNLKTVDTYIGGIVGHNEGVISKCVSDASLTGTGKNPQMGGIVGYNEENGKVSKCASYASLVGSGETPYIGGIVGYTRDTISNCISYSSISVASSSSNRYLGGIYGYKPNLVHELLYPSYNCFYVPKANQDYGVAGYYGYDKSSYYTADKENTSMYSSGTYIPKQDVYAGKACYLLNTDKDLKEPVWAQTLGEDTYPHLRSDSPNEKYVYKYYEKYCPKLKEVEKYANCSFDSIPNGFALLVTYPNHLNEDDDPEKYDCCGLYTEEYLSQYSDKDFEIKSVEDLIKFRDVVKNGGEKINATLLADIDLSSVCSESKGSWSSIRTYYGIFKGNGHSIKNLYVTDTNSDDIQALFYRVVGEVRDLRVTAYINSKYSAGISGLCNGKISGCICEVDENSYGYENGISYYSWGKIENCSTFINGTDPQRKGICYGSPKMICYGTPYSYGDSTIRYNFIARDGDLYVFEDDTLSPEMMCLKLNSYEIDWGLAEINGVKTAVPAAFASKLIYPSGLVTCPFDRTFLEYSDTMPALTEYRYPEHIDADNDGVYDCCGFHYAFLNTYNDGNFEIRTAEQLKAFADEVNSGRFIKASVSLMCDIDLSSVCSEKIGNWTPIYHFTGTFDGHFHKISGLYINKNGTHAKEWSSADKYDWLGLFAINSGIIKNTGVSGVITSDSITSGALCGRNAGKVVNCYNEGVVTSTNGRAGGLVGYSEGSIHNSYNVGDITGFIAGGISGEGFCSNFEHCYNYGKITTQEHYNYDDIACYNECWWQDTDCYILSDSIYEVMDTDGHVNTSIIHGRIADQFANGELCYELGEGWYQTLNVDPYPVLDPTHGKVLYDEEKGIYYNDKIITDVKDIENVEPTVSLVTFVVERQIIVIGVDSFRIVDMYGRDVTALNGSLAKGVYVVVVDGNVTKVVVK